MSFLWTKKSPYDNVGPQWVHVFAAKKDIDFLLFCDFVKSTNILLSNIRDSFENVYVFI